MMKLSLTFLATAALLSAQLGYAEPIPNTFNINLAQKTGKVLNTPARLKQTLNKYGLESPRMSPARLDLVASTIDLSSVHVDVEYVGQIGIGTPPQTFSMDFDTGSADIWVPYVDCARCGQHPLFDPTDSNTFDLAAGNETWALRYGDGSGVQGITGRDTIHLGDLSIANQTIGLAASISMDFATDPELDGIFGLSFPSLSYTGAKQSVVQAMYNAGVIQSPEVGVWLGRARDGGKGEIVFGSNNPNHYEGELKYVPVSVEKYWQVPFNGVKIRDQQVLEKPLEAIIDTGTTLIILPTEVSEAIHAAIPGAKFSNMYGWRLPCKLKSEDADAQVVFTLGEHDFPMRMADLVRERVAPGSEDGEELCYSGIAEARTPLIIMGDTFLRSYYSVYDFGKSAVGLAPSKL